jgi:hypothetical protein
MEGVGQGSYEDRNISIAQRRGSLGGAQQKLQQANELTLDMRQHNNNLGVTRDKFIVVNQFFVGAMEGRIVPETEEYITYLVAGAKLSISKLMP